MKMTPFEEFDRLFERILHGYGPSRAGAPTCYGCEVVVGPDCVPHMRQFGNMPSAGRHLQIDAINDEKNGLLKLVAEVPGVEKDDIEVTVQDDAVHIRASRGDAKYEGSVPLRTAVDRDSVKAAYRNGILEVSFPVESGPKGQRVRVE